MAGSYGLKASAKLSTAQRKEDKRLGSGRWAGRTGEYSWRYLDDMVEQLGMNLLWRRTAR